MRIWQRDAFKSARAGPMRAHRAPTLLAALALAGCAGGTEPTAPQNLGVGTPGVSRYMPASEPDTLAAELDRCRGATEPGLVAACAQLRTTMRNQPGNAVPR